MTTIIERRVCLEPRFLDQNIMDHLMTKVTDSTDGECTKEHGHILGVNKIVEVLDNRISSANSDIVFTVRFEARTLKPVVGEEVSGEVCMIFRDGIFIDVGEKLKILIPLSSLAGYELNKTASYYSKGRKKIKKGDKLTVKITGSQYAKQRFSCFGSLVEGV